MAPRGNTNRSGKKEKKLSKTLLVGPFRMAFPALFEPEEDDSGNEKFKLTMLFPPDSDSIDEIHDAMTEVMEDAFGDEADWPSGKKDILPEDKFYDAGTKTYMGFKKGWMALGASSFDQPGIVDYDKNEVLSKREVYGGRWARAQIVITTFDNKAKGVTAYVNHVQLLEHDEAFSGRGNPEDAFDKYKLSDKGKKRRDEDDDEDDRSSRRGRSRDRDEDEEDEGRNGRRSGGRSSGRSREADEDDDRGTKRGRGRASRDEDEEDEGRGSRGRSRGRSRDEDEEDEDRGARSSRGNSRRASRDDDGDDDDRKSSRSGGSRRRSRDDEDDDGWN